MPIKYYFVMDREISCCIDCPLCVVTDEHSYGSGTCGLPHDIKSEGPLFIMLTNKYGEPYPKPKTCPLKSK